MTRLHPALAFVRDRMRNGQALGSDVLVLHIDGARVEIFVAPDDAPRTFFAAGKTRLSYRCSSELPDRVAETVRRALLDIKECLSAGRVAGPAAPTTAANGWTDAVRGEDIAAWREWVTRSYRSAIESGQQQVACAGLPDCLDMRMRPPIQPPSALLAAAPERGPCARCGRARVCGAARADNDERLEPLRHADAAAAEIAALRQLAEAAGVPLATAFDAYSSLADACRDRTVDGALPLEYSVRLPVGERQPDRLRFVSYYPLVDDDAVREEIHRGRLAAVRALAARWLTAPESAALDAWLDSASQTQPPTLGLSIGVEIDAAGIRLQVYAHPEPNDDGLRFARAAITAGGGRAEDLPTPPVLVGIALCAGRPPALKLYHHRDWSERNDTGLLPDGLGELGDFNPGWGLAIQEHVGGRAAWVKWDFPVVTHYQDYDRFLAAFWRATGAPSQSLPAWLSGESFSPWPTWASLGRGGWALYFQAR